MRGSRCMYGRNAGMTLVELLMVVAVIAALTPVLGQLFVHSGRMTAINGLALERMEGTAMVGRMFAEAVRDSAGVAERVGEHASSTDRVVLRLGEDASGARYCVVGMLGDATHLCRLDLLEQDGAFTATRFVRYPMALKDVEIRYDAAVPESSRWIELRYAVHPDEGERDRVFPTQVVRVTPRNRLAGDGE